MQPGCSAKLRSVLSWMHSFLRLAVLGAPREVCGEFVVLAGPKSRIKEVKACLDGTKARGRQLVEDRVLIKEPDGEFYRFSRDVPLGSPSGATSTVNGGNANGHQLSKVEGCDLSFRAGRLGLIRPLPKIHDYGS